MLRRKSITLNVLSLGPCFNSSRRTAARRCVVLAAAVDDVAATTLPRGSGSEVFQSRFPTALSRRRSRSRSSTTKSAWATTTPTVAKSPWPWRLLRRPAEELILGFSRPLFLLRTMLLKSITAFIPRFRPRSAMTIGPTTFSKPLIRPNRRLEAQLRAPTAPSRRIVTGPVMEAAPDQRRLWSIQPI